jgi:hypothetical protein
MEQQLRVEQEELMQKEEKVRELLEQLKTDKVLTSFPSSRLLSRHLAHSLLNPELSSEIYSVKTSRF